MRCQTLQSPALEDTRNWTHTCLFVFQQWISCAHNPVHQPLHMHQHTHKHAYSPILHPSSTILPAPTQDCKVMYCKDDFIQNYAPFLEFFPNYHLSTKNNLKPLTFHLLLQFNMHLPRGTTRPSFAPVTAFHRATQNSFTSTVSSRCIIQICVNTAFVLPWISLIE